MRRNRQMTGAALVALYVLVTAAAPAAAEAEVSWTDSVKAAFATAKQGGRPLLVDIWAVWCAPCKLMDQTTYMDAQVIEGARRFVTLKVDADLQKTIIERYQIDVYPTVLFLDEKGNEISRLLGFVEAEAMLERMETVSAGYAGYREAIAAGDDPAAQARAGRFLLAAGNGEEAQRLLAKALKKASPGEREALELDLARAELEAGDAKKAAQLFAALAESGSTRDVKIAALEGLADAEARRGRDAAAAAARERARNL